MLILKITIFLLCGIVARAQEIGDFVSIQPATQNSDFVIPATHTFQKIIESGDPLTQGGTLPSNNDFTGYVPIGGSSTNGYLSINAESAPGGVSILDINYNNTTKLWQTSLSQAVDFSGVVATIANCSGTVTPWNTIISCEEITSLELENNPGLPRDINFDGYDDFGWCIEINPATKTVIDKRWALGNFKHENVVIHGNRRTVYQGADASVGYLYKFVADNAQDLSSGALYVYQGSKNGPGAWIQINNATQTERNTTVAQSAAVGATVFNGIEDVEIGPDGWVYFAVKNESRVYRFQDSDPISGTTVPIMETFVGNRAYDITYANGTASVNWSTGNDNLAFDDAGNLWVLQDGGSQNYIWVVGIDHTQNAPNVRIFGNAPAGSEPTGITFSPDYRFLFMSIQHPNTNNNSTQTDVAGNPVSFNKSTTFVLARKEDLGAASASEWYLDADGDGFAVANTVLSVTSPGPGYTTVVLPTTDCDDKDAAINPVTVWYRDADGDGFAALAAITSCTSPGTEYTLNTLPTTDCDDDNAIINPGTVWYRDGDGDGYADPATIDSCASPGTGYTTTVLPATDCDDDDPSVYQAVTWYLDGDGDGYADPATIDSCASPGTGYTTTVLPATDCDDDDPSVYQAVTWYLDGDGDGYADPATIDSCASPGTGYTTTVLPATDCDDDDPSVYQAVTWYLDGDGDGYADPATIDSCASPGTGYTTTVLPATDCDDDDPSVYQAVTWYLDGDGDGYADPATIDSCASPGTGYTTTVLPATDCDDSDPSVYQAVTWYLDGDGDGYADPATIDSCASPGTGYTTTVLPATDCDDNDGTVNLNALWYLDADGDGYADALPINNCSSPGEGYSTEELPLEPAVEIEMIVYPNPSAGLYRVAMDKEYRQLEVSVATASNQSVFRKIYFETKDIDIDFSALSSGVYFLNITAEGNSLGSFKMVRK